MYFIPPALIFLGFIDYQWRYHIMAPVIISVLLYALIRGFSTHELGMVKDNFLKSFLLQSGISVSMTVFVILLMWNGSLRSLTPPQNLWFYIMYLFVSGPVQEFIYRSVPFAELDKYTNMPPWLRISLITFNFAWLHVIYFDVVIFIATLIMGVVWTTIYYFHKNYWAVSIAHAACGFLAIWYGLI